MHGAAVNRQAVDDVSEPPEGRREGGRAAEREMTGQEGVAAGVGGTEAHTACLQDVDSASTHIAPAATGQ